jgi:nucleoside-diphosphate-sugar epimerase
MGVSFRISLHKALNDEPITLYGDGSQTRSFLYVSDQIQGMYRLIQRDHFQGEVVNIGSTNEITILELAETILDVIDTDSEIEYRSLPPGDPERRKPSIKRADELLDWSPTVELSHGIEKTVAYFEDN